jgi:hypothetical protein
MGCSHPQIYNSPQLTSIEAYGCGYVTIDAQLLESLLDGEDHKDLQ